MKTTAVLPRRSLWDVLQSHARDIGGQTALRSPETSMTYHELLQSSERCSRALLASSVRTGDIVAVYSQSRPETFVIFLACCRVGALFLGLGPKSTATELAYILADSGPRLLIVAPSEHKIDSDKIASALDDAQYTGEVVVPRGVSFNRSIEYSEFETRLVSPTEGENADDVLDRPCAIVYTSGTTGRPKGALLAQRSIIRSAELTAKHWYGNVMPLRTVAASPVNHVGWLVCKCVTSLLTGGTLHFRERFDGAETLRLIEAEKLNVWTAFPAMVSLALSQKEFETCDLRSLERVALGSMPASSLLERFRTRSRSVFSISYGLTEACGGSLTVTDDDLDVVGRSDNIGRILPGVEMRVVDASGSDVPRGASGELLVRDESVFLGYLNRPEATAEAISEDGWLHTGDAVSEEPDGSLRFVGRLKEMFKSGGYNVYPAEVESVIASHPGVAATAVVAAPHPVWEQVGVAFVVLKHKGAASADDLDAHVRSRAANYKVPKLFVIADDLPRLANEKFDKQRLTERAKGLRLSQ